MALNKILLHSMPNGWCNQALLQVFDIEAETFNRVINMLEFMEITESFF